jgi:hypothetical protein
MASPAPAVPKRNGRSAASKATAGGAAEASHVTVVAGDPPMLQLEIKLYSWERGDSEIEVTLPHGSELGDLLEWALPEQRLVICGNLRARIQEELAEVFEVLSEPGDRARQRRPGAAAIR